MALEPVKEPTLDEKMLELRQDVGKAFFDYGRIKYEIEVKEKELGNISVNIHNLNLKCLKLQEEIDKEAKIAALKAVPQTPGPEALAPNLTVGFA